MKYMFVSDIHGNVDYFLQVMELFNMEKADKLVILGDTSAYLSKNSNEQIAEIINNNKEKIVIIRGNCDSNEFEELLSIEMFYRDNLYYNGKFITVTHGDSYNMNDLPPNCGEIFIQGHTHVPLLKYENDKIIANPGSVSRPRGVDLRCYIIIYNDIIELKTLEQKVVKSLPIK